MSQLMSHRDTWRGSNEKRLHSDSDMDTGQKRVESRKRVEMEETLLIKQQENERLQAKVAELENKLAHCANCEQLQTKQAETDQLNKQVMA